MEKHITPLMITIGDNIRKERDFKGIKQEDLADAINISTPTLSKIENGHDVSIGIIEKICNYLKLDFNQIFPANKNSFYFNNSPHSNGNYFNYVNEQLIQILNKDIDQKNQQIIELIKKHQ